MGSWKLPKHVDLLDLEPLLAVDACDRGLWKVPDHFEVREMEMFTPESRNGRPQKPPDVSDVMEMDVLLV